MPSPEALVRFKLRISSMSIITHTLDTGGEQIKHKNISVREELIWMVDKTVASAEII